MDMFSVIFILAPAPTLSAQKNPPVADHEWESLLPCCGLGNNFYFYVMNLYGYQDGRGNLIVVRAKTKTNAQGRLLDKGYAALYSQIFMINKRDKEENKEKSPMSLT
jgi:hypothetical protein